MTIHLPIVSMRKSPSVTAEIVSEALFGEVLQIKKEMKGWVLISTPDGYSGWIRRRDFYERKEPYVGDLEVTSLQAHIYRRASIEFGPLCTLAFGSKLKLVEEVDSRWNKILLPNERFAYIQKGDTELESLDLTAFSKKFLGIPYTWGGRSSFGFDCSGFVQMLYKRFFVFLPRDAKDQFLDPRGKPISLDELVIGDLIFWGISENEIRHVALYLDHGEFIHTSSRENKPYLRISKLSDFEWSGNGFYRFRTARRFDVESCPK